MKKAIPGIVAGILLLSGIHSASAGVLSAGAAPLTPQAATTIEKNIDFAAFQAIGKTCDRNQPYPCHQKFSHQVKKTFDASGYSLDLTLRNSYLNTDNLMQANNLGWNHLFLSVVSVISEPAGGEYLIQEGILTQETVDTVKALMASDQQ